MLTYAGSVCGTAGVGEYGEFPPCGRKVSTPWLKKKAACLHSPWCLTGLWAGDSVSVNRAVRSGNDSSQFDYCCLAARRRHSSFRYDVFMTTRCRCVPYVILCSRRPSDWHLATPICVCMCADIVQVSAINYTPLGRLVVFLCVRPETLNCISIISIILSQLINAWNLARKLGQILGAPGHNIGAKRWVSGCCRARPFPPGLHEFPWETYEILDANQPWWWAR